METTFDPEVIYEAFSRYGFAILRIDRFDRGNYAEVRLETKNTGSMRIDEIQHLINNLRLLEKGEHIEIQIVHLDLRHQSLRLNMAIPGRPPEDTATIDERSITKRE